MRRLFSFGILCILLGVLNANQVQDTNHVAQTHILFTDPFEDVDDSFTILTVLNQIIESSDRWYIVTANEIVDGNGIGLRAKALSQWLDNLHKDPQSPLRPELKLKLNKALQSKQLTLIQGLSYLPFQQDFEQNRQSGKGDTHFYAMSLVAQYDRQHTQQKAFPSIFDLREQLLTDNQDRKLNILGIASARDIATVLLGKSDLFDDSFDGRGDAASQIQQAKTYYQQRLANVMKWHNQSESAQRLVSRVSRVWQMSGGFQQHEEYNEHLSRIANDYLNHLFNGQRHGITPINTTALLHPMLEFMKQGEHFQWPVDQRVYAVPYLTPILQENLFGNTEFAMPGYYDKYSSLQDAHTLNHDLLAFVESNRAESILMHCQLHYWFQGSKQRIKRSYDCVKEDELPLGWSDKERFTLAISPDTLAILQDPQTLENTTFLVNQRTDTKLTDTLHQLFAVQYDRVGIFDFDGTITVDESFSHPVDDLQIVRDNTKADIDAYLRRDGSVFAISSFIDSTDNIVIYLRSIFAEQPQIISQKAYYLPNSKRGKMVLAFYLSKYNIKGLPMPVYVTTLPKLTGEIDPETGERNIEYHMAREALAPTGKNIPMTEIARHLLADGEVAAKSLVSFYDDDENNAQHALACSLFGHSVASHIVTPHIKPFVATRLNIDPVGLTLCSDA